MKWKPAVFAGALLALVALTIIAVDIQLFHMRNTENPAQIAPDPATNQAVAALTAQKTRVIKNQPDEKQDTESKSKKNSGVVARVVKKGDTLAKLILETYGTANRTLIDLVKQNNPEIVNENIIHEGYKISFPTVNK
jgi:general secretion pathway protein A